MRLVNRVKFPRERLIDEEVMYNTESDEIIDQRRWSTIHEIVFELDGKYWMTTVSQGSTEMQDEEPWEYETEVECTEVIKKVVMTEKWVPADESA